ncbi:MAG: molecular chaperone HtpG [Acholeplasmatales bacterium]|jgi:molecular chaperone HtpG|nr:molecular chaperone HtpG [Acholeplasmatales bacterium]
MKQFKAESKKVLDLMINSIYTNREIFLRELLSNASDAEDKLYYKSLKENLGLTQGSFNIKLEVNKKDKTISITDNGIGMTKDELETFLGTIAKSDSEQFNEEIKDKEVNVIGRFGVGFYSAFMIAKKINVISKKYGSDEAYIWSSSGIDGYTIKESKKDSYGTQIILYLKDDTTEVTYSNYLEEYEIRSLVKKYSNYIKYPINMDIEKEKEIKSDLEVEEGKEKEPVYEKFIETETLNSMTPIWTKKKKDITDEEFNEYYKSEFHQYENPISTIFSKVEGNLEYTALLYIPSKAPYNLYYKNFEKGLKLYSNNILIMDKCKELLPDYFAFTEGIVSCDLDLNISRETVQTNYELKKIAQSIEKKIKSELETLLKDKRSEYEEFYKNCGLRFKYSIYESYGSAAANLQDLLLYKSLKDDKLITLKEYKENIKENQKQIYYVSSTTSDSAKAIPQTGYLLDSGYDVLLFSDDIDEFVIQMLGKVDDLEFKNITTGSLGLEELKTNDSDKELVNYLKEQLKGKVDNVKLSGELKKYPVALTSDGNLTIEMEKLINKLPNSEKVNASKILEINYNHSIYQKLLELYVNDKDKLNEYASILLDFSKLIAGLDIEDKASLVIKVSELLS